MRLDLRPAHVRVSVRDDIYNRTWRHAMPPLYHVSWNLTNPTIIFTWDFVGRQVWREVWRKFDRYLVFVKDPDMPIFVGV
jgi:hypothetical protein